MVRNILRLAAAAALVALPTHGYAPIVQNSKSKRWFHSRPLRQSSRTADLLDVPSAPLLTKAHIPTESSHLDYNHMDVEPSQSQFKLGQDDIQEYQEHQFTPLQHVIRMLPFAMAGFYMTNPQPLDDVVATVWSWIYNWDVAQNPLFEAEVASGGFILWIASFSALHLFLGPEQTKASRFDGEMPHRPFEWVEHPHLWFNPTAAYLGSIWLWLQIHEKPPMPELAPTFGVLSIELLFGVWLYDLCFFPVHYLMHRQEIGKLRRIHGYHHRSGAQTMNALETVQHSYIDGFLQVVVNILVQHISPFGGPKHVFSRLLHNLTVTFLLSEAHSGYNLPWMSHNIYPEIFGGSPRHERHHANGKVYYQQYFKYLDDFLGLTEEDELLPPSRVQNDRNVVDAKTSDVPKVAMVTTTKSQQ
jgi:sterol desaturase/sphingolipid hydroxylase (fatty acid hydroxylase superfamily)